MLTQTPICDFGKKAVPFKLKSTEGKIISLEDLKGLSRANLEVHR